MEILVSYNPSTRRHDQVTELKPGVNVVKMYWSPSAKRYVTVPGASLFVVNGAGELEPAND